MPSLNYLAAQIVGSLVSFFQAVSFRRRSLTEWTTPTNGETETTPSQWHAEASGVANRVSARAVPAPQREEPVEVCRAGSDCWTKRGPLLRSWVSVLRLCVLLVVGLCSVLYCFAWSERRSYVYNAGKYIVGNYTFLFQHNFWRVDLPSSLPDFLISSGRNNAAILGRVITCSLICDSMRAYWFWLFMSWRLNMNWLLPIGNVGKFPPLYMISVAAFLTVLY
jgi:hypothetical protein